MATDDFFRARLDSMIDMRHPLAVLATRMPWAAVEASLAPLLAHMDRSGCMVEDADLFGATAQLAGAGLSNAGRPRLPLRLMVALLYLKHAFNLSDEELCERWSENVVWQFFSGMAYYEPRLPCDATQIGRFRRVLGEAGVEQLLKSTIEASVSMGVVKKTEWVVRLDHRTQLGPRHDGIHGIEKVFALGAPAKSLEPRPLVCRHRQRLLLHLRPLLRAYSAFHTANAGPGDLISVALGRVCRKPYRQLMS